MNIEQAAKKAIRAELTPFEHLGVCATFRTENDGRIKATLFRGGKASLFHFPPTADRGPREIQRILDNTRAALVQLGAKRAGSFGEQLSEAILKAPSPLPHEQEVLCPDAIAQETAEDEQEIQVMSTPTQTVTITNGHSTDPGKRGKLTRTQTIVMGRLLAQHGGMRDDGLYCYVDGWDDARVHRELQTDAALSVIVKTRQEAYGKLRSEMKVKKADRMEALEATVADMTRRLDVAENRIRGLLEGKRNG